MGKLYRKQFLEKNEAVFENLPYAEDKLFNIQCYLCNPKYAFIQETGYIYRKMMTPFHLLIGRIPGMLDGNCISITEAPDRKGDKTDSLLKG